MRSISAKQFKEFIEKDPAWASKLTGPVDIRTYANMDNTGITHLSPMLHFSGRDENGNVASFKGCSKLEVAEGTFRGFVDFGVSYDEIDLSLNAEGNSEESLDDIDRPSTNNVKNDTREEPQEYEEYKGNEEDIINFPYATPVGIKRVGELYILEPNTKGCAVDFTGCAFLKEYRGIYPGHIEIGHHDLLKWARDITGEADTQEIEIKDLEVRGENNKGFACTIHNSTLKCLKGKYESAIRIIGTNIQNFGSAEELTIKPNATGTKIELKHNQSPSTIEVKCFAEDFPFEAHEISLPRPSTKKEGDPLSELRDVLKIKKALLSRENPKNADDPWHKQLKRYTVRSIAQCLKADDILKKEGHQASSRPRLKKIVKASALIATIFASLAIDIGKEIKDNTLIEPTAQGLQEMTSQHLNKKTLEKFSPKEIERRKRETQGIEENVRKLHNEPDLKDKTSSLNRGVEVLGLIASEVETEKLLNLETPTCSVGHCNASTSTIKRERKNQYTEMGISLASL